MRNPENGARKSCLYLTRRGKGKPNNASAEARKPTLRRPRQSDRMIRVFLLLAVTIPAFAQGFSVGVKAGVPLTDAFHAVSGNFRDIPSYFSNPPRYTLGPTVELRLPLRLSIELDALYKRLNYNSNTDGGAHGFQLAGTTGNSWEFPLLLKHRLSGGPIRPYLAGGVTFDRLSGFRQLVRGFTGGGLGVVTTSQAPTELKDDFRTGVVLGGGLEVRALFLRLSPEIRYTRWGRDTFRDTCCLGSMLRSNPNQAEFLLGITF